MVSHIPLCLLLVLSIIRLVPWDYPNLSNKSTTTSPFTIVFSEIGSSTSCPRCLSFHLTDSPLSCCRLIHEHRHPHLGPLRRQSRPLRGHACPLRPLRVEPGPAHLHLDDARRHSPPRAARDEQREPAMLRQQLHRQRAALGLAAEHRGGLKPGRFLCALFLLELSVC